MSPPRRQPEPPAIPPSLAPIVRSLSREPGVTVEKGWGSSNISLKVRGKIFAMSMGQELVLKLRKERVDALADSGAGTRFDPRKDGRVMKEWIVLPAATRNATTLAREALLFVGANA